MKIIENFISIQGEGLRTGRPSLFIRLSGCNLRCVFHDANGKSVSCCDTNYASFSTPEAVYTNDDIIKILEENPQVQDIVITGGEPLLDQSGLEELIIRIKQSCSVDHTITIETNGSLNPSRRLLKMVDLWSVSPKLSSSIPNEKDCRKYGITEAQAEYHARNSINPSILGKFVEEGHDCQLKFVYSNAQCEAEIKNIIDSIQKYTAFNVNDYVMLMPEGITEKAIIGKSDEVVQCCIRNGWTYTSRMHILIWGNVKEK